MIFFGLLLAVDHFIDTFWTVFCSCHLYTRPSYDAFAFVVYFLQFSICCGFFVHF